VQRTTISILLLETLQLAFYS